MRRSLAILLVLGATACAPGRVDPSTTDLGWTGVWQLVAGTPATDCFAGLRPGDRLVLERNGRFAVRTGAGQVRGRWLVLPDRLRLKGFATDPAFPYPTSADWLFMDRGRHHFTIRAEGRSPPMTFRRVAP